MPSGKPLETDWKPVVDSYRSENAQPRVVRPNHKLGLPYEVAPAATLAAFFKMNRATSDSWNAFYRRYPGSGGYLEVSAVGFDAAKTRAMVYLAHSCGSLCGGGQHYLLEQVEGTWREAKIPDLIQCMWRS